MTNFSFLIQLGLFILNSNIFEIYDFDRMCKIKMIFLKYNHFQPAQTAYTSLGFQMIIIDFSHSVDIIPLAIGNNHNDLLKRSHSNQGQYNEGICSLATNISESINQHFVFLLITIQDFLKDFLRAPKMYRVSCQYRNTFGQKKSEVRIKVETRSRSVLETSYYQLLGTLATFSKC